MGVVWLGEEGDLVGCEALTCGVEAMLCLPESGVIVPRLTDTVMAMLYEEMASVAAARGLFAIAAITEDRPDTERLAIQSLLGRRVDGLILTTARLGTPLPSSPTGTRRPLSRAADGRDQPILGRRRPTRCAARDRHLIDLGHTRIGLVGGPDYASSALARREGYQRALAEAGIGFDESLIAGDSFSMQAGETAGHALLFRPDRQRSSPSTTTPPSG